MAGKYASRLAKGDQLYKAAEAGFPEVPPGEYAALVRNAEVKLSSNENLGAQVSMLIVGGEHEGMAVSVWYCLEHAKPEVAARQMGELKKMLEKVGIPVPEHLAEVEDAMEVLAAQTPTVIVRAEKEKNGDRVFTRIVGLADAAAMPVAAAEEQQLEEEGGLEVGARVQFANEGSDYAGSITSLGDGVATVQCDNGEQWEDVPLDALVAEGADDDAAVVADLMALAQAQGLEVDDGMGLDALLAILRNHAWVAGELTEDEVMLLSAHGITPAKAKPTRTAKPVPAPTAKKAAPAPAPKAPVKAPAKVAARKK